MKFVLIFGPSAVGKMSVGQALADLTDMKLFHNHLSIEAVRPVFDFGTKEFNHLVALYRMEMMKTAVESDIEGLIFTLVWALDNARDFDYVNELVDIFESKGKEVFYVELEASLATRLIRNKDEKRLLAKPSKRNLEIAERVLHQEMKYQLNTKGDEFNRPNHLKINNENRSPEEVAHQIVTHFGW
ncbi:MAG: shikimate kinase [Bacteroidota bacterium]